MPGLNTLALIGAAVILVALGGWALIRQSRKRGEAEGEIDNAQEDQRIAELEQLRRNRPASRRRTLEWLRKNYPDR